MKLLSVVKSRKILLSKNYYDVVNVACGKQIKLNTLIKLLETGNNKKFKKL